MRQFAIQALVDERTLWDVMRQLEQARATAIVARPYYVAANGGEPAAELLPAPPAIKKSRIFRTAWAPQLREIILKRTANGQLSTTGLRSEFGGPKGRVYTTLNHLVKLGAIRRIENGIYAKGSAKGIAAAEALNERERTEAARPVAAPAVAGGPNMSSRVREVVLSGTANGAQITTKQLHALLPGLPRGSIDRALFTMNRDGRIRRVEIGTYVRGTAPAATSEGS